MKTIITKAICLNFIDYKDNDRLVKLFSIDLGLITAKIRGIKKAQAKLKMVSEPFCFAEVSLIVNSNNMYQIIGASILESFFDITKNLDKFYLANIMLETTSKCLTENTPSSKIFLNLLKSLKGICYENKPPEYIVAHYIFHLLNYLGYRLNFKYCSNCGESLDKTIFFDNEKGGFVCENCKKDYNTKLDREFLDFLQLVCETPISESEQYKFEQLNLKPVIEFLGKDIEKRTDRNLLSIKSYIDFTKVFRD